MPRGYPNKNKTQAAAKEASTGTVHTLRMALIEILNASHANSSVHAMAYRALFGSQTAAAEVRPVEVIEIPQPKKKVTKPWKKGGPKSKNRVEVDGEHASVQ